MESDVNSAHGKKSHRRVAMLLAALTVVFGALSLSVSDASAGTIVRQGGMNLNGYCAAKYPYWQRTAYWGGGSYTTYFGQPGYPVLVVNNAYGWRCEVATSDVSSGITIPRWTFTRYSINMDDVCRWQYGKGYAVLEANHARGWACYAWIGPGF